MTDRDAARRGGAARVVICAAFALLFLLARLAAFPAPARAQGQLAARVDALLARRPHDRQLWGIAVLDERGRLLYGREEGRLFVPASTAKLAVSAAAAALLPPGATVRTSLYAAGPVASGVVRGDLVLYGRGDPTISRRCYATDSTLLGACDLDPFARLRRLADSLRARGVRTVAGDVVGDGSYFEPTLVHPSWQVFDVTWWYAAPVSGLGFNDNSVDLTWQPGLEVGAPALLSLTPNLGDIALENRTLTVPPGGVTDIGDRLLRLPGSAEVWAAEGTVAVGHPPRTESFALPDPNLYAARALRQVLAEAGIAVVGATRSTTDSLRYAHARARAPLAEVASRPVRDWIFPIQNKSQNWFAEMLLKQLGRRLGASGSWGEGLRVVQRFLIDSVRIDSTSFALADGSGLSTANLVTPLALARLLHHMRRHPRYPVFAAGLPRAGGPGSLRTRFAGTPLAGRVRAKTGSIARSNALSGYLELEGGRVLSFAVLANNHAEPNQAMLDAIDSVVVTIGREVTGRR